MTETIEGTTFTCCDGVDNDGDGLVDSADPACAALDCSDASADDARVDGGVSLDGALDGPAHDAWSEPWDLGPAPVCGNGTREFVEGCDDGNLVGDDGCDADCHVEASVCAPGTHLRTLALHEHATGDTTGRTNASSAPCTGAFSGEDVWALTLPHWAELNASFGEGTDANFHPGIYIRSDCDAAETLVDGCGVHFVDPRGIALFHFAPLEEPQYFAPGTYYLFVDGSAGEEGVYDLELAPTWFASEHETCGLDEALGENVHCMPSFECVCPEGSECPVGTTRGYRCEQRAPAVCGNGIVELGEDCDDPGGEFSTCGPDCHLVYSCPDASTLETIQFDVHISGSTVGRPNQYPGGVQGCSSNTAGDVAYAMPAIPPGYVAEFRFTRPNTDFDARFVLAGPCDGYDTPGIPFAPMCLGNFVGDHFFTDERRFLYIDGVDGAEGNFDFIVELAPRVPNGSPCVLDDAIDTPAFVRAQHECASQFCYDAPEGPTCIDRTTVPAHTCGDGILHFRELCDDGNTVDGDGCASDCSFEERTCLHATLPTLDTETHVTGSTLGQASEIDDICGGMNSGEDAYSFHVDSLSRVILSTRYAGTDFPTVLDMRANCFNAGALPYPRRMFCDAAVRSTPASLYMPQVPAGNYTVWVDGLYGASGNYELGAWSVPLVQLGEHCLPPWQVADYMSNCAAGSCIESADGEYTCRS